MNAKWIAKENLSFSISNTMKYEVSEATIKLNSTIHYKRRAQRML